MNSGMTDDARLSSFTNENWNSPSGFVFVRVTSGIVVRAEDPVHEITRNKTKIGGELSDRTFHS